MTTPLIKLISIAEAATQGCHGHPDEEGSFRGIHSPVNMLKLYKAVEEKDQKIDEAVKLILQGAGKKCRCYERFVFCPYCDPLMQGEDLYDSAIANFNQTLEDFTK